MSNNTERDELADLIERTGQVAPSTVADLRLKDAQHYATAILAAGYVKPRQVSTVAEMDAAKAEALREAADKVMGPSEVPLDAATCRWIAMELRERAAELSPVVTR